MKNKLMARSDGPFEVIEKVGSNACKLQIPRDMAVSATFNIEDLSPYVEDTLEDTSDLRQNPSKEGRLMQEHVPKDIQKNNQGQGDQDQIQALFSFTSSWVCTVLGNQFRDGPMVMIGRVLLFGLPNMSIFSRLNHFWIMLEAFCPKGSFWHLAQIGHYSAWFYILL